MKIALIVLCLMAYVLTLPTQESNNELGLKIAICEAKLHEAPCIQCCNETNWGFLAFAEEPACELACQILPN